MGDVKLVKSGPARGEAPAPSRKHLPMPELIALRRAERMSEIDKLPPPLRECVHDYGWAIVHTLLELGIEKPRHIRHIVELVLDEFSPTRGSLSAQGIRPSLPYDDPRYKASDGAFP